MKRASDFAVGGSIVAVSAAIIMATLWLNQTELRRRDELVALFRDVGNARVGAPLVIRGVRAGRLQSMELDETWVRVRFSLDRNIVVPENPVVLLNESSLFGEWQATVLERGALPRDVNVRQQIDAADAAGDYVPGATLPDIAQLTAVAGRIAGDVAALADRVDTAFDAAAARELRLSIRNFARMSNVLSEAARAQSSNLDAAALDVRVGVRSLLAAADRVRDVAARFDSSTARGEVNRIVQDAGEAARQLRQASSNVLRLSGQLDTAQATLVSVLSNSDTLVRRLRAGQGSLGMFLTDSSLYYQTDSLLTQLRRLVADVQANPRKYLRVSVF
jgi:phospholipid/cholesterol/gamma-HCH transport system substrate-binding protein